GIQSPIVANGQSQQASSSPSGSVTEYLDQAGVFVVYNSPSSGTPSLTIYVPQTPVTYNLALAPVGAQAQEQTITLGVGQTVPGTSYVVQGVQGLSSQTVTTYSAPTALIGKVVLDTQVSPTTQNIVVVGGPAINTLAAQAVINWVSAENSTLGQQLAQVAAQNGGYIYGSQLQPVLQQLGVNFGPGTALVFVPPSSNEVVIFGWEGPDTTQATQLFATYLTTGYSANVFDQARVVLVNTQQTVNGQPTATKVE
ncbi:MAG: hypothetical protein ACP5G1_02755, partial [Nanopusillaceae archaeon]